MVSNTISIVARFVEGGTDIKERNILEEKILISYQKKQTMFCIDAESKCVWYQLCVKKEWNMALSGTRMNIYMEI